MKRLRIPAKGDPFNWVANNFGIGGFENYSCEQIADILSGLSKLLNSCGSIELYFLGKLFMGLSDYPEQHKRLLKELEIYTGGNI